MLNAGHKEGQALQSEPQDMAQVNGSHKILVCHANFVAAKCQHMQKTKFSLHTKQKEQKDKKLKKIILMAKKCSVHAARHCQGSGVLGVSS